MLAEDRRHRGRQPAGSRASNPAGPAAGAKDGSPAGTPAGARSDDSSTPKAADRKIHERDDAATDVGVTRDTIKLGSINMHGMAFGNLITDPVARGDLATIAAINDRGGILGSRLSIVDCDDGPGEVSRTKSCLHKLAGQDKVFALVTGADWATASIHDDLRLDHLPYVGAWAYSQTEWQDPFMFPTHMSMLHEALAGASWVRDVIHPRTYGLICLTSPEMQLACGNVTKVLDPSGARMVKKVDISISETTMSAYVLAMRSANPEHIVHYVINPATIGKFMIESQQQGYYPPKGMSGNHLAAEILGSVFGQSWVGRYWTNTTYKLWGREFIATMHRYAPANEGQNHHVVHVGYVGINFFAQAAPAVGPNLTRDRLMAQLGNGTVWASDASLDQHFAYTQAERSTDSWSRDYGQGREFMYKYAATDTRANPDGSTDGWQPDPDEFVIHAR